MLNLKNTLDGYLKNVEVIGNTVQDENNLADIRSVGDKVEGQELYKIDVVSCGKNLLTNKLEDFIDETSYKKISINLEVGKDYIMSTNCPLDNGSANLFIGGVLTNTNGCWNTVPRNVVGNGKVDIYIKKSFVNGTFEDFFNGKYYIQLEEGTIATSYEPYQGDKLEILSPVQLEKVGNVADRIICKDGVWGIEKNVGIFDDFLNCNLSVWVSQNTDTGVAFYIASNLHNQNVNAIISNKFLHSDPTNNNNNFVADSYRTYILRGRVPKDDLSSENATGVKEYLHSIGAYVKYVVVNPQFIPLPHDQQVKIRTFAGQTNISFLTEITGQIKAQVPKSLGATVNTHTEQISNLNKELDRVKKLEESTVSTVETESNFTAVDATSNGYFEDVKLEGKTLNNLMSLATLNTNTNIANMPLGQITGVVTIINAKKTEKVFVNLYNDSGYTGAKHITSNNYCFTVPEGQSIGQLYDNSELKMPISDLVKDVIILEGDHTNNPPEYFEGLMSVGQDVEEASVISNTNMLVSGLEYVDLSTSHSYRCDSDLKSLTTATVTNISDKIIQLGLFSRATEQHYMNIDIQPNTTIELNAYLVDNYIKWISFIKGYWENKSDTTQYYKHLVVNGDVNKKPLIYYNPTTETWEKPILREWDTIEKHSDGKYYYHKRSGEVCINNIIASNITDEGIVGTYRRFKYMFNGNILPNSININNKYSAIYTDSQLTGNSNFCVRVAPNIVWVYVKDTALTKENMVEHFNGLTVVYQLAQEEVYECTNIDLMTYSGETNYIINSGAISPKSLLKVHNNISNVVKILQEKVSLLENTFIAGLKSVLAGDMYSLATILYPEDFEQNDTIENDIMVIPE